MADTGNEGTPERRGEAAYKAHLDGVNARNAEARKAGKLQREERERQERSARGAAERRMDNDLARKFEGR